MVSSELRPTAQGLSCNQEWSREWKRRRGSQGLASALSILASCPLPRTLYLTLSQLLLSTPALADVDRIRELSTFSLWQCFCCAGSPRSPLEARNRWWLWRFLPTDVAADLFIPQWGGLCSQLILSHPHRPPPRLQSSLQWKAGTCLLHLYPQHLAQAPKRGRHCSVCWMREGSLRRLLISICWLS